jgi:CRISPR-associated protein Cmx8
MARSTKRATTKSSPITLSFDLLDLPTAQHKAGLAGLLMLIDSLPAEDDRPEIVEQTPTSAQIRFTARSIQALFDDLYDAAEVEVTVGSKWAGQAPKRQLSIEEPDPGTGRIKKVTRYVYDVVQPTGRFLRQNLPDESEAWHKLWREMLWAIPRAKPRTRIPFNERSEDKHCSEGKKIWTELQAFEKARAKNSLRTCEVAGAILLGAQAVNAEGIAFEDRCDHSLLLHFWQITVLTFVPQVIDQDGQGEFVGYVLAIPEVCDLQKFMRLYPRMLRNLPTTMRGYRPAAAVIDLPEQGAIEFMYNLARLAEQRVGDTELTRALSGVEFYHMVKLGNNVKTMASGRVGLRDGLLAAYEGLKEYRNPLFRSAAMRALLRGVPWHRPVERQLATYPWPFFVKCEDTPGSMPWFATDAAAKFRHVIQDNPRQQEERTVNSSASPTESALPLEMIVHRVVQTYVRRKTEEKSGCRYEDFKDKTITDEKTGKSRMAIPSAYAEAKQKICSDAFLAFRSRRGADFVDYFTSTIGQVAQFLPPDDYRVLAEALLRDDGRNNRDDVKTLAMLALSATSY